MPPFVPRKRDRSSSPKGNDQKSRASAASKRAKSTLFDALDTNASTTRTVAENKAFLDGLAGEDASSQSEADSDEFEDVEIPPKKRKGQEDDEASDTENEMEWEDALVPAPIPQTALSRLGASREFKDLEITLSAPGTEISSNAAAILGKKGPSKKERLMRIQIHCMHVQCLLYHNFLRNSWINDKEVQKILVDGLSDMMKSEVARYRRAMGVPSAAENTPRSSKDKIPASDSGRGKGKGKAQANGSQKSSRDRIRDWGADALRLEPNTPNLSQGDPLYRLLKYLSSYWKKRFRITAPGLRKRGYYPTAVMAEEIQSFRKDTHDQARHGERIRDIHEFRDLARKCEGSRDVGAQLFTTLLRALNIEARLVASLQPAGFGWTKAEEADPKKKKKSRFGGDQITEGDNTGSDTQDTPRKNAKSDSSSTKLQSNTSTRRPKSHTTSDTPHVIDLEDSSELSSAPEDLSDASLIDITPSKPLQKIKAQKSIDDNLPFPIYWTEALSPVTNTYISVSPLVLSTIATSPEQMSAFEPRGKESDRGKQVISYVVAYASDGTAKDVTVRYLKRRQLPGKTKGVRMPIEKIPIYNKNGKVKRYEQYDWFKDTMRSYTRSAEMRTLADDIEDNGDLVPVKVATKKDGIEKGEDSLQAYKASAEYVLQRHLRREEAILPSAEPVRHFTVGKGDNAKSEPVFLRKDVVTCKTVESWHKEGREIKEGEQPLKMVPIRAVTLIRKREIEDQIRENGEKPLQGLYSWEQTDWIVPEPIQDGKIPRNSFGNIDVYVSSMIPKGAVHVPLKGTAKICKKLGIDFAEACTGFEFGKQRAVPVLTGVVVAEENEELLKEAWLEEEEHKRKKEEGKREKAALAMWRKFLMGLRIIERVREEYGDDEGHIKDAMNPFTNKNLRHTAMKASSHADAGDFGGGFLLESDLTQDPLELRNDDIHEGFPIDTVAESDDGGGGFIVEHDNSPKKPSAEIPGKRHSMPISLQAAHADNNSEASISGSERHSFEDMEATESGSSPDSPPRSHKEPNKSSYRKEPQSKITDKKKLSRLVNSNPSPGYPLDESESSTRNISDNEAGSSITTAAKGNGGNTRALPKRQAAKKSQTAIRSHYFERSSGDDKGTANKNTTPKGKRVRK